MQCNRTSSPHAIGPSSPPYGPPERPGVTWDGLGKAEGPNASQGISGPSADPHSFLMYEVKSSHPCQEKTYDEILQGDGKNSSGDFPRRLDRFGKAKVRSSEMAAWMASVTGDDLEEMDLGKRSAKLAACGDWLWFRQYPVIDEVRLHAAEFCQLDRLCPLCASRRGAKLLRRHTERAIAVMADRPGLVPYMVTHTICDGPDLGERYRHLSKCLGTMMLRRRRWLSPGCRKQPWTEAARAVGAVHSVEVKRGSGSGSWHPHAHAVWLCQDKPDQEALRAEWKEITGDSHVVDVRPFDFVRQGLPATIENVASDFSEVFKYALKFADLPFADNWTAFWELRRRRLVASFGALFGVEVPADLLDAPLDVEDLPFIDLLYRFGSGRYQAVRDLGALA